MSKRFTDTEKWKKSFIKGLPSKYKLLWFYIIDDCNHAGIWDVDIDVASIRIGETLDNDEAVERLGDKIVVFDNGMKWFIPSFIEFQYGELNQNNRPHVSVINLLIKYDLIDSVSYKYAHKVGNSIKGKKRSQVFVRDDFTCVYCDMQYDPAFLEPDHVVPLTNGGTNDDHNIVTSCSKCNRKKLDRTVESFCKEQGYDFNSVIARIKKQTSQAPSQGAMQGAYVAPMDKDKDKDIDKDKAMDKAMDKEPEEVPPTPTEPKDIPPRKAAYSVSFDEFWKAYPRKAGKDAAWKAWQSRIKAGTLPSIEVLSAAIDIQKRSPAWTKDAGQFIPHPATWLNQGRWQDEQAGTPQSSGIKYWNETPAERGTREQKERLIKWLGEDAENEDCEQERLPMECSSRPGCHQW